jgi:hypothetical protein
LFAGFDYPNILQFFRVVFLIFDLVSVRVFYLFEFLHELGVFWVGGAGLDVEGEGEDAEDVFFE